MDASGTLTIPSRFRGPESSGNGGYTAGILAGILAGRLLRRFPDEAAPGAGTAVTVRLRLPPPLDRPLQVELETGQGPGDERLLLVDGGDVVAEARTSPDPVEAVDAVSATEAAAAEGGYGGLRSHPFPGCFVCGVDVPAADGMHLRPGPLGGGRAACRWIVQPGMTGPEFVWAALDCPSGWSTHLEGRPMVLGEITATLAAARAGSRAGPRAGEVCVVTARHLSDHGRRSWTASTAYGEDGRELGRARAVWIALRQA